VNSGRVGPYRSRDEIASAIRSFTPADFARLKLVARKYSLGRPMAADDLLQEAYQRALDSRVCPANVDVVKFLAEAMRSIAHGESEKVENRHTFVAITSKPEDEAQSIPDGADTAEAQMMADEHDRVCIAAHAVIVSLFDDDPVAKLVLEGMMEELSVEEIRELTGLDKVAYDSKRKLIRRRVDNRFPGGLKP
jgi:DNA-directed RNA polymerase specialized sigma24 family protein